MDIDNFDVNNGNDYPTYDNFLADSYCNLDAETKEVYYSAPRGHILVPGPLPITSDKIKCHFGDDEQKNLKSVIVNDERLLMLLLKAGLDSKTLVLFDVDITLIYAEDVIAANDFCFPYYMDHYEKEVKDTKKARALAIAAHNLMYSVAEFKLVSDEFEELFRVLDKLDIDYLALTARDKGMAAATIRQLGGVDIGLVNNTSKGNVMFNLEAVRPNAFFEKNIIFCDAGHKGECLLKTLQKANMPMPNKIIFVDDKEKNLHQVRETAEKLRIPYLGVRYGLLDEWVKDQTKTPEKCVAHLEGALAKFRITKENQNINEIEEA